MVRRAKQHWSMVVSREIEEFSENLDGCKVIQAGGGHVLLEVNEEVDDSHPTPFPVALAARCINATVKGLVLDPFIGSGSTAIVAEKLKRPWVGIEQSANYVSMAARRIGKMRDIIDELQTPPM